VFKVGETGREITLYHVQEGQTCLINMLCVFLGKPAMATAAVETPVEAVIIPAAAFRDWVRTRDSIRHFIFETMAERMVAVMTLVEEVAFRRMDTRLAAALLNRFDQAQPANFIATTHEEIAAELGTAREVVSRLLKELERQGAVHLARGRVELHDAALLRRLAEEK
jgi:CRP/FNR family transcriptional regulator